MSVQVTVHDAAARAALTSVDPPDWQLTLDKGTAEVTRARGVLASGGGVRTLLAIDGSPAFETYATEAFQLADHYLSVRLKDEAIGVVRFDQRASHYPTRTRADAVRAALRQARVRRTLDRVTELGPFLVEAIDRVADEQPEGLRQVVLFTDGGLLERWSAEPVIAHAQRKGVRLHVLAFTARSGAPERREARLQQLADDTGGEFVVVEDVPAAREALAAIPASGPHVYQLDARLCGVVHPRLQEAFEEQLVASLHRGARPLAQSDPVVFEQHASGVATEPCGGDAVVREVPARPARRPAFSVPDTLWGWMWAVGSLAVALLGLIAAILVFTARRRAVSWPGRETSDVPPTVPPAPPRSAKPSPDRVHKPTPRNDGPD